MYRIKRGSASYIAQHYSMLGEEICSLVNVGINPIKTEAEWSLVQENDVIIKLQ